MINKIRGGFGMREWSLKKKITIGIAAIGASVLGIFAYGKMNQEVQFEDDFDEDDFDEEPAENVGFESDETAE